MYQSRSSDSNSAELSNISLTDFTRDFQYLKPTCVPHRGKKSPHSVFNTLPGHKPKYVPTQYLTLVCSQTNCSLQSVLLPYTNEL
jgi:hypothetical protein